MKYKIIALFGALIISINSISITAYATSSSGAGYVRGTTELTNFDSWSSSDKFRWWKDNVLSLIAGGVGVLFNPLNWNYDIWMSYLHSAALDRQVADDSTDYQEYISNRIGLNDSGELVIDDELNDLIYLATDTYVEEETGYFFGRTFQTADTYSLFHTKAQYSAVSDIIEDLEADQFGVLAVFSSSSGLYLSDSKGVATYHKCLAVLTVIQSDGFVDYVSYPGAVNMFHNWSYASTSVDNYKKVYIFDENGNELSSTYGSDDSYRYFYDSARLFHTTKLVDANTVNQCGNDTYANVRWIVAPVKREVRIYKNFEEYKAYTVGQRTYMATSKFQDYDVNGDNSCIISESDLANGSVYGDVYNYVINNYDNPDSLTEDQLIDILDKYFENMQQNTDSSGGSSGSNSGGSGSGLSGFLSGLGSVGDAILSILGKLLEYVGKAIDLFTNTATKVIDLVPQNVTNLNGALFSFFPQDWLTAIELSLVLAVIIGIVGIFKK